MIDQRWTRVKALFQAALERPAAERNAFLAAAVGGDDGLRREVEALLASDAAPGSLLDRLPFQGAPALATGQRIGVYEVIASLGAGGMGEVYRSRDTKLNRAVALKVLPEPFARDSDRLSRFRREAQLVAALNHPNIAAIYGVEESAGVHALVLELVEGPTLADRIATGPLPWPDAVSIARQIAEALETAHERGIVHRDLKPANVKVRPDGVVKVLDFGLAKALSLEAANAAAGDASHAPTYADPATRDGIILGTPAYMSPEQAKALPADRRADIWAFGCVLFEMIAGTPPFRGETTTDLLAAVVKDDPDWSALPQRLPRRIRTLLRRCLTKDPRQRLQAIGEARIEIEALGEDDQSADLPTTASRRFLTTWLPWIAVAALAAGVIVRETMPRPVTAADNPLASAQFTPLTDWPGTEGGAEISPDGRFAAFLADQDGEFDIWLHQIGTDNFRNLTSDFSPLQPIGPTFRKFGFNGEGSEIWFSPDTGPALAQMIMPLIGGPPRAFLDRNATAPAWAADGSRLAYFKNGDGDPMFVGDRSGADARQILIGDHNHNPVWSPNGDWIYFTRGPEPTHAMDVWRVRPTGESLEQLTTGGVAVNFIAPLDRRTVLYTARADDFSGPWLWVLDAERKTTRRVATGLGYYTSVSASRDGRRAVATVANPSSSLWQVPLLDREAVDRDVRPLVLPTARALAPRFAGSSLFYLSASGSGDGLWRSDNGQSVEIAKGQEGGLFEPPAVAPDGSRAVIVVRRGGKRHLLMVSTDGRSSRTIAPSLEIEGAAFQSAAAWSADGTWIVTGGRNADGPGLFRIPSDGGEPTRIVRGEAENPVVSPDGTLIVYGGRFFTGQVDVFGTRPDGTPVELPPLRTRPGGYRFLPDGTRLVYIEFMPSIDFGIIDVRTGRKRQLTRLSNHGMLTTFDVTPDGKSIVFDRLRENSDIVLIDVPRP